MSPDFALSTDVVDGLAVFLIGVLVGSGELVSHYKDEPFRALASWPAIVYLAINGGASLTALIVLRTLGWTPGGDASAEASRMLQIFGAGFGAMAIFRSSLLIVRVGKEDIGVGPVAFLDVMLKATDRGVDRKRASDREKAVVEIMHGLAYDDVKTSLPVFALQLMQNLSLQEVTDTGDAVRETADPKLPEETRTLNLGLVLMDQVGESVLRDAVRGLKAQLGLPDETPPRRLRFLPGGSNPPPPPPVAPVTPPEVPEVPEAADPVVDPPAHPPVDPPAPPAPPV